MTEHEQHIKNLHHISDDWIEIEDWSRLRASLQWAIEQLESRWVSVEDRLPELNIEGNWGRSSKNVLAYCSDGHQEECVLSEDAEGEPYWCFVVDGEFTETVTHWMPLPESPKTEEG